jgi:K+-sensing histidine kinase KdpD
MAPGTAFAPPSTATVELRRIAESVGASFHVVVGEDVAEALLEFGRDVHAGQLLLGIVPRHGRHPLAHRIVRSVLRNGSCQVK